MSPGWTMDIGTGHTRTDSVLHLDLHPMNVMLSRSGPVVIDWTNSTGGPAGFDAALSYVEMATFVVAGLKDQIGARVLIAAFKRARGAREIDAYLAAACDHRLGDAGLTPGERVNVAALRKKAIQRARVRSSSEQKRTSE